MFALQSSFAAPNQQIKYRIQCATSADKDLMVMLEKVPELMTFTLPTGSKIYFSGGYFNKYQAAEARLEEVRKVGIKSAFIRVFKYSNMLSKPVGDEYLKNAKNKIAIAEAEKKTLASAPVSNAVKKESAPKMYTREEIEALKKKAAERKVKEEKMAAKKEVVKEVVEVEEKPEVIVENDEKKKEAEYAIDEPPVYKISLGKTKSKNDKFEAVSKLNDEIIYTHESNNEIIYAIGFYGNEAAALKDLAKYRKISNDAEVIGLYKEKVISLKLANQLFEQFNLQNN